MRPEILGHQNIKKILNKQFEAGKLAHAYLFVGPKGTGKKSLAKELAEKVLGLRLSDEDAGNLNRPVGTFSSPAEGVLKRHPDYYQLDCSQDASAETVREFVDRMALKPFLSKRKFALLSHLENLNAQGVNALLKTLEEPPQNTVIVLTANTGRILPTILSRCQVFSFNRALTSLSPRLHQGGEAGIGGLRQEEEARVGDLNQDRRMKLADFAGKSLAERLLAINQFADLEEEGLKNSIEDFIYESADDLHQHPENYHRLTAGLKAFEDLGTSKNRKLVLQGLLRKI